MKTQSKKELQAAAQKVFNDYPAANEVYAREDGNIFFSENHADLGRGKMKVYNFQREDVAGSEIEVDADELITDSNGSTTVLTPVEDQPEAGAQSEKIPAADDTLKVSDPVAPTIDEAAKKDEAKPAEKTAVKTPAVKKKPAASKKPAVSKTTGKNGKNPENRTNSNTGQ